MVSDYRRHGQPATPEESSLTWKSNSYQVPMLILQH